MSLPKGTLCSARSIAASALRIYCQGWLPCQPPRSARPHRRTHVTKLDPGTNVPIELGAEFVHGKPPEIWDLIRAHHLKTTEVDGDQWCFRNDQLKACDFFSEVDEIFQPMDDRGPDRSFTGYLKQSCPKASQEAKEWALGYVQGFHAADPGLVSVHSLVKSDRAEEAMEGHRSFHIAGGYAALLEIFSRQLRDLDVKLCSNTAVENISWAQGRVQVNARDLSGTRTFSAAGVVTTLPLGVLQAGAVQFSPVVPDKKQAALQKLEMGHVNPGHALPPPAFLGRSSPAEQQGFQNAGGPQFHVLAR